MVATAPLDIPVIEPSSRVQEFLQSPRQIFINGKWQDAASGKTFPVYNPASGQEIAQVAEGDSEDIARAVAAARKVFDDPSHAWNTMTPSERGKLIWKIGDLILENLDELAELESLDNGKPMGVDRHGNVTDSREASRRVESTWDWAKNSNPQISEYHKTNEETS